MKKWYVSQKKADFDAIGKKFGIDPVVARILRNRDVITEEEIDDFLNPGIDRLHDPASMLGADRGAEFILSEIDKGSKVRVVGDYDVDGVCAAFILLEGLRTLGADADYDIPDRVKDGYGINTRIIDKAYSDGIDLIVTCDNGIAAVSEIAHAKELGMKVIVTDHHEIPYEEGEDGSKKEILPPADIVINPHQAGCQYAFKGLCGAVVAYKFLWQTYKRAGRDTSALLEYLDIAALATVADVMELKGENRIIVKLGMERMKNSSNLGLRTLINITKLEGKDIGTYHLGFVIGPCINAGGRMDTAKTAVELLLAKDRDRAISLANELYDLNISRKDITDKGAEKAVEIIEESGMATDTVLVVYLPDIPESIIGIIAGRIKEKYYRPAIVLSGSCEQGIAKGSGRSIEAYNMFAGLSKCKDLFEKFGGHAMAAGLSIKEDKIDLLRKTLNDNSDLTEEDLIEKVVIDVPMPIGYVTEKLVKQLELLEPFGNGNKRPVFAQKGVDVLDARHVGAEQNVLHLTIRDENSGFMKAVKFNDKGEFYELVSSGYGEEEAKKLFASGSKKVKINIVYYPKINEYKGRRTIQADITDFI